MIQVLFSGVLLGHPEELLFSTDPNFLLLKFLPILKNPFFLLGRILNLFLFLLVLNGLFRFHRSFELGFRFQTGLYLLLSRLFFFIVDKNLFSSGIFNLGLALEAQIFSLNLWQLGRVEELHPLLGDLLGVLGMSCWCPLLKAV